MKTLGGPLPIHPKLVTTKLVLMGLMESNLECPKPNIYKKAVISTQKEYLAWLALSGVNGTDSFPSQATHLNPQNGFALFYLYVVCIK